MDWECLMTTNQPAVLFGITDGDFNNQPWRFYRLPFGTMNIFTQISWSVRRTRRQQPTTPP